MTAKNELTGAVAEAEATRDKARHTGFAAGLYEAETRFGLLNYFDKAKTNPKTPAFMARFTDFLLGIDPEAIDSSGDIPEETIRMLGELTAFALKIPEEYGGLGMTQTDYQAGATLMGSHCGSTVALISANNSLGASETLKIFGTGQQKNKWWPRLVRGEISGLALTESGAGCDVWNQASYAVPVRNTAGQVTGYRLFGRKQWCTNSVKNDAEFLASILVVVTRVVDDPAEMQMSDKELKAKGLRKRYGAFVVDTSTPGMRVIKRNHFVGLKSIYNGDFSMDDVFVAEADRVRDRRGNKLYDNDGLVIALTAITTGRLTLPAACLGGMKQCLRMARIWAKERKQMGKPLYQYQGIAERIVRIASRVLALEGIMKLCGAWADNKLDLRMESMAAKVLGSQWYLECLMDVYMIRAGKAYETASSLAARGDYPWAIERMLRDCLINLIFEGANPVLRLSYGREGNADYIGAGMALTNRKLSPLRKAAAFWPIVRNFCASSNFLAGGGRIGREARKLTRESIITIAYHQEKLQDEQQLALDDLAEWGMNLFAQAATLSYGDWIARNAPDTIIGSYADFGLAARLAEWFYNDMEKVRQAKTLTRRLLDVNNMSIKRLATAIVERQGEWLEDGIIPLPGKN